MTQAAGTGGQQGHEAMTQPAANAANGGFTLFVPYQAAIIQAAARLIPTDDLGPRATEAGVVYFIDQQLSRQYGFFGFRGPRYNSGPFMEGEATQGDQLGSSMRDRFRIGTFGMDAYAQQLYGKGFASLAPDQQDRILQDMDDGIPENFGGASLTTTPIPGPDSNAAASAPPGQAGISASAFFDLLLSYTFAGFFADPVQGGNRDMVGWKLIGFPGAHIGYADVIQNFGQPFEGDFISIAQYQPQITGGS